MYPVRAKADSSSHPIIRRRPFCGGPNTLDLGQDLYEGLEAGKGRLLVKGSHRDWNGHIRQGPSTSARGVEAHAKALE